MLRMVDAAAAAHADLIVFPELAYTGHLCPPKQMRQLAEPADGFFVHTLCDTAKEKHIHIIAGYPEADVVPGCIYNSAVFIDDTGTPIENMRKVYAWGREKAVFREGDRFPVVKTGFGRVGLLICYDAEFPEPARIEALKGAEIIVVCSIWSIDPAERRWHIALRGNALFNLLFIAGCNSVGKNICGSSMIVGPDGEERAMASRNNEELLLKEIDLDEVLAIRSQIPYLKDFKENTFR